MKLDDVYFTWPDARFRYDCRGCGACCKGHGIGLDVAGGQLVQLVARRPEIASFLRRRGDAITAFNPRDRCWFLEDDGLCRIEVEDGRAAKPASCRLFPFNRVFRLGAYTIVDYNSVICPLVVARAAAQDVADAVTTHADTPAVTHAEVRAEIESIADPTIVGTQLPARDAAAEGRSFVESERAIATALFDAAARLEADLRADVEATRADPPPDDREAARAEAARVENVARSSTDTALRAGWAAQADAAAFDGERASAATAFVKILGAPWTAPSPATLGNALWLTPSMRFNELFGPRQYAARSAMAPVLARMWLAWLGFAALGETLARRPLGLQELTTLWSEQAPLMHAVARWSEIPALKPGPIELPGVDPSNYVRRLGQTFVDNRKARKSLGAIIEGLGDDPTTRVTALKLADAVMRAGFAR